MVRRIRNALVGIPLMLVLVGCAMDGVAVAIPKTPAQACDDLERAARDFYAAASPNSTMRALDVTRLPEVNGFTIPRPSCSFEFRPDPAVVPGDVFTIENFYLDYDETLTLTLEQDLEAAGYVQRDPEFMSWSTTRHGRYYSAAVLIYLEGDEQAYTEAADGRVLDLSIGQG